MCKSNQKSNFKKWYRFCRFKSWWGRLIQVVGQLETTRGSLIQVYKLIFCREFWLYRVLLLIYISNLDIFLYFSCVLLEIIFAFHLLLLNSERGQVEMQHRKNMRGRLRQICCFSSSQKIMSRRSVFWVIFFKIIW